MDTVRALSRINFVVFSQLVRVELPRGVASMFVVPCKIGYRNQFRYHLLYFFLLIPCETCCHESSKKCASYLQVETGRFAVGFVGKRGLLPTTPTH